MNRRIKKFDCKALSLCYDVLSLMKDKKKKIIIVICVLCLIFATGYRLFLSRTSVTAVRAIEDEIQGMICGPGTVQSRVPVTVSTKITGILEKLYADHGDQVTKGQLLAELDTRELMSRVKASRSALTRFERDLNRAKATLAKSEANLTLARSNYRRDSTLFERGVIPEADMDSTRAALKVAHSEHSEARANLSAVEAARDQAVSEVHVAEANLGYAHIKAPMDGLITERVAEAGDTIIPGSPVFQMVDPTAIWAAAWIDEIHIAHLKKGCSASIRLRSGRTFDGKVVRINKQADVVTRELEVDVQFTILPDPLIIGEEAEVKIYTNKKSGLVIPLSSVLLWQGKSGVLTIRDERAIFSPVSVQIHNERKASVTGNVQPGDLVILQPTGAMVNKKVQVELQPWSDRGEK